MFSQYSFLDVSDLTKIHLVSYSMDVPVRLNYLLLKGMYFDSV